MGAQNKSTGASGVNTTAKTDFIAAPVLKQSTKKKSHKRRIYVVSPVAYEATTYWPGTNILKTNHNVFNPAIRATDDEKPINWQQMQTRADVSYHASKNADSTWTRDGGEFISAIHRGLK